jgi:TPR repeat protein
MALPRSTRTASAPWIGRLVALCVIGLCASAARAEAPLLDNPDSAPVPRFTIPSAHVPPTLYRRAVEQADPVARYDLASRLESGRGMPADPAAAVQLYRLAADQGYAPAQAALGQMLRAGSGIARNQAEAARRFKQAAEQGSFAARQALAEMRVPLTREQQPAPPIVARAPSRPTYTPIPASAKHAFIPGPFPSDPNRPVQSIADINRLMQEAGSRTLSIADCRTLRGHTAGISAHMETLCLQGANGNRNAARQLAQMYFRGDGVAVDHVMGIRVLALGAPTSHSAQGQSAGIDRGPESRR